MPIDYALNLVYNVVTVKGGTQQVMVDGSTERESKNTTDKSGNG